MGTQVLVFKILFLVLIAHSFVTFAAEKEPSDKRQVGRAEEIAEEEAKTEAETKSGDEEEGDEERERKLSSLKANNQDEQQQQVLKRAGEQQVNYAELCYLSNGGSSLTLTVNEATRVGSIIGALDVNGDPSLEGGNVDLSDALDGPTQQSASQQPVANVKQRRLLGRRAADSPPAPKSRPPLVGLTSEPQQSLGGNPTAGSFYSLVAGTAAPSPQLTVRLEPGTKNLVLVRPLDKESPEGEQQTLVVNIRCRPRPTETNALAESTTIPVRLIITDANDHAPAFVGPQPYVINVSETAPLGSVVSRDILALDGDSAGPFSTLHYRVLDDGTAHSALLQFANPLEPTLVLAGQLDFESLASFTITIVAQDEGEPEPQSASAQVQVNVVDFDDQNPRFMDDKYTLVMDETQQNLVGQTLQVLPRNLHAEDGDRGIGASIMYSFDQLGERVSALPDESSSVNSLADETFTIERYLHLNPTSGELRLIRQWPAKWAPMTLVVRATQGDNRDRYSLTTLTITPRSTGGKTRHSQQRARTRTEESTGNQQNGLEFAAERLVIEVAESAAINEKIARVRARHSTVGRDLESDANQTVDLVPELQVNSSTTQRRSPFQLHQQQQQAKQRPINYQILDDQTDQFGINGLGEIFIKKPLDFEQKQEHRFRVLATYTKHSDICQVQVNVLNVNDNKPKFTQPQYTFHLTESRLRSNMIGSVQANDGDLNDSVRYSLTGDQAHLFEINSTSGLLSLRPQTRQLNITGCQLTVIASDSLGAPLHTQQARVNLHVAPQLIGRSLNFDEDPAAKLFNSRSLTADNPDSFARPATARSTPPSNQRSSVATVVSSLQHMVGSAGFLEMPATSALLLSALLAFLVCLLFVLVVSMSVHFYRRHSKLRQQRHHLAATAHLRRAHLTARSFPQTSYLHSASSAALSPSGSSAPSPSDSSPPTDSTPIGSACAAEQQVAQTKRNSQDSPISKINLQETNSSRRTSLNSPPVVNKLQPRAKGKRLHEQVSQQENSLVSSLSSQSTKRSYRSNTTDDSSVMHCGHYSVAEATTSRQSGSPATGSSSRAARHSSIEAAIKSLVRGETIDNEGRVSVDSMAESDEREGVEKTRLKRKSLGDIKNTDELSNKLGIKSYRKLPLGSLVRPVPSSNRISPMSANEEQRAGLMAMIREPELRLNLKSPVNYSPDGNNNQQQSPIPALANIRWPQEAFPSRVKRLTWDDELSHQDQVATSPDCFVAPEILSGGPMSPLSSQHEYPIGNELTSGQQHFLFSTPCSPTSQLASNGELDHSSSIIGQNNHLDYTIVQSSQFQVDSLAFRTTANGSNQPLVVAAARNSQQPTPTTTSYLYSNNSGACLEQQARRPSTSQDLKLMTSAVL